MREASWNRDALLPLLGLAAAVAVALRGPFRRPARFLLVIFFLTAFFQALFLPVKAPRYEWSDPEDLLAERTDASPHATQVDVRLDCETTAGSRVSAEWAWSTAPAWQA